MSDNPMKVLVVEQLKAPYVKEIDGSLGSMQALVGGDIEATYDTAKQLELGLNTHKIQRRNPAYER